MLIKTDIIFDHAKIKNFRGRQKEPPANGLNSALYYRSAAKLQILGASTIKHSKRHHFCSRKGSKWVFLGEFEGMTLFGTKAQVYYKTAVKVQSAGVLRTHVRVTVVFQNSISKKRPSCEHVCKVSRFRKRFSSFVRLLLCFLKALQNRSEKLKSTPWSTQL